MLKIILSGALGTMGRAFTRSAVLQEDIEIVCGIDIKQCEDLYYKIYPTPQSVYECADVIVDFSHPDNFTDLLHMAEERYIPIVVCTTGLSKEQVKLIHKTSKNLPIFYSRNMSVGMSLLVELCKKAAKALGNSFDIEIIEKHHNQKIDAPSGSAYMLGDAIKEVTKDKFYSYQRHFKTEKRDKKEIGMHSIRGGTIVGEHEVLFAGNNETITITHSAQSKEVFALGALDAARFLIKQEAGLYTMEDLLSTHN